jgi:hypothetical protein
VRLLGRRARADRWLVGFAVRRVWPDGGHEFIRFTTDPLDGARFVARDRRVWRWGPIRPVYWSVVSMSRNDFELHRRRLLCQSPDCPDIPPSAERVDDGGRPEEAGVFGW